MLSRASSCSGLLLWLSRIDLSSHIIRAAYFGLGGGKGQHLPLAYMAVIVTRVARATLLPGDESTLLRYQLFPLGTFALPEAADI